jgi:predicted alpha/beta hydrolase
VNEATETPKKPAETEVVLARQTDFQLSGRLLLPHQPKAAVLISSGTGLPKEFYLHFARFGVERGVACLVFDYRGVAASAPKDLRSFEMDYTDWGRLDMPAALERLAEAAPRVPIVHVAHSVGGHLAGFMPNHHKIARHVFVSVGLGTWWKHRFPMQQLLDLFFWWIYGPFHLARTGYIPAGGLWGGSTLPAAAFRTWRRWAHKRDYFRRELDDRLKPHYFDEITAPIVSYVFADDPLTTRESAREFLLFLPNAKSDLRLRRPSDLGVKALGHQNVFRRRNAAAWPEIWGAALEGL